MAHESHQEDIVTRLKKQPARQEKTGRKKKAKVNKKTIRRKSGSSKPDRRKKSAASQTKTGEVAAAIEAEKLEIKPSSEATSQSPEVEDDGSGFDAGIFDDETPQPIETSRLTKTVNDKKSEAPPKKPSRTEKQVGPKKQPQTQHKKVRRSRKHRLAEEAEVIATLSQTASGQISNTHPDDSRFSEAAATKTEAQSSAGTKKNKRTKSRRATKSVKRKKESTPQTSKAAAESLDFDEIEETRSSEENENTKAAKRTAYPSQSKSRATTKTGSSEPREMLINVAEAEECRIAILRDGRLDELHIERAASSSNVGNIYKGRVTNVEPSIQAAFVDFGLPAHGFLHISDLHPQYFPDGKGEPELVGKKTPRRQRPPIQNCLKRGQEVIVQVIKEGIGTKGPTLSSYVSLPGRFLVMMPGMDQLGVSRKIEDEEKRRKTRELLSQLSLPKEMGIIVRTAGVDRLKRDLQRDLNFLTRLWKKVAQRIKNDPAPAEIYKESDLVIRTIRDVYDSSLQRIVVDSPLVANRVREFLSIASPRSQDVVEVYEGAEPMFHRYGIEAEIDRLHSKTVPLPCGGSIVIEQTEAMVAIDVNSGKFRVPENAEETSYRVNLEAVDEIARQLRLRDLGGLIVCDLIDMGQERHRRTVERRLSEALRKHKERAKVLRISKFGLLEMTRQRQRPSLTRSTFRECPRCGGSGRVKAPESVALDVMRRIRLASHRESVAFIDVRVATPVANDLLNRKRLQLSDLERSSGQTIRIQGVESFAVNQVLITCTDRRGREVQSATASETRRTSRTSRASQRRAQRN